MIPAAGGIKVDEKDIVILDDNSPDVWLIETKSKQTEVGVHKYTLTRGKNEEKESVNLLITVRNTNDATKLVSKIEKNFSNKSQKMKKNIQPDWFEDYLKELENVKEAV